MEVNLPDGMKESEDKVLICPFEKHKLKDEVL
jgi:hypothetical protein